MLQDAQRYERLDQFLQKRISEIGNVKWLECPGCDGKGELIDAAVKTVTPFLKCGSRVLDVGFGTCRALERFKDLGLDLDTYGITMSHDELEKAKGAGHKLYLMDMSFMTFEEQMFDLVFARHVLEHSVFPFFTLSEFYRVLRPGGTIYVEVPAPKQLNNHENFINHYSVFDKLMWASLLRRTGFKHLSAHKVEITDGERLMDMSLCFIGQRTQT